MNAAERAELERQGAKAAARGEASCANPLLQQRNLPAATGESLHDWSVRHDAWRAGYESQSTVIDVQSFWGRLGSR
jgi:hypothetical protein